MYFFEPGICNTIRLLLRRTLVLLKPYLAAGCMFKLLQILTGKHHKPKIKKLIQYKCATQLKLSYRTNVWYKKNKNLRQKMTEIFIYGYLWLPAYYCSSNLYISSSLGESIISVLLFFDLPSGVELLSIGS